MRILRLTLFSVSEWVSAVHTPLECECECECTKAHTEFMCVECWLIVYEISNKYWAYECQSGKEIHTCFSEYPLLSHSHT